MLKEMGRLVLGDGERGFRRWLRLFEGATTPGGAPAAQPELAVLREAAEWRAARDELRRLRLPCHPDPAKNWDTRIALDGVLRHVPRSGRVLDAGAALYSTLLPSLFLYGYRDLHGINLLFDPRRPRSRGPIRYQHGDITRAPFPDAHFDAITCLSVIEHGVDVDAFFREASRLLKPGGRLITSTDYWRDPVDTRGQRAYGTPIKIFTYREIRDALDRAASFGVEATTPLPAEPPPADRVVTWKRFSLSYTFLTFTLAKRA